MAYAVVPKAFCTIQGIVPRKRSTSLRVTSRSRELRAPTRCALAFPEDPLAIEVTLGLVAASFCGTFFVAPLFRQSFKGPNLPGRIANPPY